MISSIQRTIPHAQRNSQFLLLLFAPRFNGIPVKSLLPLLRKHLQVIFRLDRERAEGKRTNLDRLVEYTTRFTHPLPFNDHENLFETAVVPSSSSSTVIPRSRLSLTHQYRNSKRYLTHRINDYTLPQTSSNTVDALLRERVIIHQGENSHHPSDPINRINQILRKRLY